MKWASVSVVLLFLAVRTPVASTQAAPQANADAGPRVVVDRYCVSCHNARARTGGIALDTADAARPEGDRATWERVVRRLRTRSMPPAGSPRPDDATYDTVASALESALDLPAAAAPDPGRYPLRRLNRTEYGNAIGDLLALPIDAAALLPPDDAAFGFDNNADLLGVSPALVERYVAAADTVSALAVGAATTPGARVYRVRQDRSQDQHVEGLPLGTVGGLAVTHVFPVSGQYRLSLELFRTNLESIRGLEQSHEIEISIDGERVFAETVGGARDQGGDPKVPVTDRMDAIDARLRATVPVAAGPHVVGAAFVRKLGAGTNRLRPFLRSSAGTYDATGRPHIETLTVAGPFGETAAGNTPSRARVFTCRPPRANDDARCAEQILSRLARVAYRRDPTVDERRYLMEFYRPGRARGGFEAGVQMGLRRILASPAFILRAESQPRPALEPVPAVDLASRLSFFLWSSIPDEGLLDAAQRNELATAAGLERQVRRMLADPRAERLVRNFAGQWLHVRNLPTITPNHDLFPDFDDTLRDAFRRETELFVASILLAPSRVEGRPSPADGPEADVLTLLNANHTFVNERLAKHYGMPHVYGSHFRRVTVSDDARRGLLGKGSLLLVTSHADRTAPVLRGKWILENLIGTPPAPPPANFALAEEDAGAAPRTIRERMERHRANPACAGCHRVMDPLGFALEQFDAVGAWRTREQGRPVDASGELTDGTKVDGVESLRRALAARPEVFYRTFAEKLLVYALGRGLRPEDMPAVRGIVAAAGRDGHRFSSFVLGVATSTPFRMRRR